MLLLPSETSSHSADQQTAGLTQPSISLKRKCGQWSSGSSVGRLAFGFRFDPHSSRFSLFSDLSSGAIQPFFPTLYSILFSLSMPATFTFGQAAPLELDLPEGFPVIIETADAWEGHGSIKRRLGSYFNTTDFGAEKVGDDQYIIFPFDKQAKSKDDSSDTFKQFLESFAVHGELSPKSKELFDLFAQQKLKYADSEAFLKASKLGFLRLTSQLVVLRREILKSQTLATVINTKAIPINAMGDLEASHKTVSLKEAIDFMTQQMLVLMGAQRFYDDLLGFWNDEVSAEEKRARDPAGAAPFWAAQKEKFLEHAHLLTAWPEFGSSHLSSAPKKDSLLWLGQEALTDSKVKTQERRLSIEKAYHSDFKQHVKHFALCHDLTKTADKPPPSKRKRYDDFTALPEAPRPTASMTPTLSAPRAAFAMARPLPRPKNRRRPRPGPKFLQAKIRRRLGPLRCGRCKKPGHEARNCHSRRV